MIARLMSTMRGACPKPTRAELLAAAGKTVPDVIAPRLRVLFCGINPGLYSGATGHHFARPGNRFWPALHRAGFTDRLLSPCNERDLLQRGCGITNLVARATSSADELTAEELHGRTAQAPQESQTQQAALCGSARRHCLPQGFRPAEGSARPTDRVFCGATLWVLPNPSGLNAHHQLPDLTRRFRQLYVRAYR
jgi:TDG/mug DNA glycosylase family protein